jgi:ABC-2 type transport system ATP-binding protein
MALISSPSILFLDEPTLGLDVRARRDLWKLISKLKGKMTIVLTTHYLEEAETLTDRIGIMHEGQMLVIGNSLVRVWEICPLRYLVSKTSFQA